MDSQTVAVETRKKEESVVQSSKDGNVEVEWTEQERRSVVRK
jgi:hypothetical protein